MGASASIAAVLGASVWVAPYAWVLMIFPGFGLKRVPAWVLLGVWLALQVGMSLWADSEQLGVGFEVHAAGFLLGMVGVWVWRGVSQGQWQLQFPLVRVNSAFS